MTAALEHTPVESARRVVLRSPGLHQFRRSPFRLLRLSPHATAAQALWQCDKVLARARVGLAMSDLDPLPWLPGGDDIEIQEAVHTLENPLARMVEQLLWFAPSDDGEPASVGADANAIFAALSSEDPSGDCSIARRLNGANLRLLLGFALLHDTGPTAVRRDVADAAIALRWQTVADRTLVEDVHAAVQPSAEPSAGTATWDRLLDDGVRAWAELLTTPELAAHVRAQIAALGDELLTNDDLDAVLMGVRTRIIDLIVGETKLELVNGRLGHVALLSSIAARSQFDPESWRVPFRTLRSQFQSELAELAPDSQTGLGVLEDVNAYLDRVAALTRRWQPLDDAELLGLSTLIDDAVQAAFARLRAASRALQASPRFAEVLSHIGEAAQSAALKERVKGYQERLADVSAAMCHFCGKREAQPTYSGKVKGKKETSRKYGSYGYTIYYDVASMPVARCKHCAALYDLTTRVEALNALASATLTLFALVMLIAIAVTEEKGVHELIMTPVSSAILGVASIFIVAAVGAMAAVWLVSRRIIPKGERACDDYQTSAAAKVLRREGYDYLDYSPDLSAVARRELRSKQDSARA